MKNKNEIKESLRKEKRGRRIERIRRWNFIWRIRKLTAQLFLSLGSMEGKSFARVGWRGDESKSLENFNGDFEMIED